ncbi:hypothetical protein Tco_0926571 [Tanacetum coccineum]|uniref:Uncharacterized protein n=1 Tax=Tanacetum coccineum TaxID=301880 RepID=A0ABQ5DCU3_9ASTR
MSSLDRSRRHRFMPVMPSPRPENNISSWIWCRSILALVDLMASIEGYYEENIDHREQTDKIIRATMYSLDKTATDRVNLLKTFNGVTKTLKAIQDAVIHDPDMNKKIPETIESFTKISSDLTELLSFVKGFDYSDLQSTVKDL